MGAPDWVAADACQAFSPAGIGRQLANARASANYVQWHFPARGKHPEMMAYYYDGGLQPPRPLCMSPIMGMPGRGLMFVGEKGVQVSAFYGGSNSLPDHTAARPGQRIQGFAGGWLLPEGRFRDFKQPEPTLPRCERPDHYSEWIQACKAGKKSIMPVEFACDMTEFALTGVATLRRYSMPANPGRTGGWGGSGRSDSAVVWIPASSDGHVHVPGAKPPVVGTGEVYTRPARRSSSGTPRPASSATTKWQTPSSTRLTGKNGTTRCRR